MSREDPQLRVRIPAELKETLEQKAKENKRTLTAEIVDRLEETTVQDSVVGSSDGFGRIADDYENLCGEFEELREKYEREYALDWADSNKDELRHAVERLHELLNHPSKK
ncbi:Rha family transcriptional regulator [Xenorhabdus mauleonii]|uniref:Arc-like DNA binding domain-containing protein n=1 Tax=Xenorhabdus mauleonii TaxID=351675 RepID=A0A1I3WMP4_9GAMM|nr:Arc family DNA-binding protein [Xenorhabdus mauleonii]PHM39303.1 Rha family transcriptional regulator [Xenorhabdus mauleonii]SFK08449.1 Arc-like DNA binding domain-containing protein [Xenorhabdus mauleonii]